MAHRNESSETTHDQVSRSAPDGSKLSEQELLADLRRVAQQIPGPVSEQEYTDRGKFGVTTFRRRFGSWNTAKQRAGLQTCTRERIDEERLLDDLRRVARAVDGPVTEQRYAEEGEFGVTTFRRRFGSWNAAKQSADLETERQGGTTAAVADDIATVVAELDTAYVTPELYAERGGYPLAALPTEEAFWESLRDRVGLAVTPLYHKVVFDSGDGD